MEKANKKKMILLVGNPNVGKSAIFNMLTGAYATVSNYPGTTVEVFTGKATIGGKEYEVVDTPGLYSLMCITDEEKVTRNYIIDEKPALVLHIVDAKNIRRMLPVTLQLIEAGLPVMLVLNMMDEALKVGMDVDIQKLEEILGIPVVKTIATARSGISVLIERIQNDSRAA